MTALILLLFLLGSDIELNLDPISIYHYGIYEQTVRDYERGFCCDGCDIWYYNI